jgi:hypothetical protein
MRVISTPANVLHSDNHELAQIEVNQHNAAHRRFAVVGGQTDLDSLPMELFTAYAIGLFYLVIISPVLKTCIKTNPLMHLPKQRFQATCLHFESTSNVF